MAVFSLGKGHIKIMKTSDFFMPLTPIKLHKWKTIYLDLFTGLEMICV